MLKETKLEIRKHTDISHGMQEFSKERQNYK